MVTHAINMPIIANPIAPNMIMRKSLNTHRKEDPTIEERCPMIPVSFSFDNFLLFFLFDGMRKMRKI